MRECCNLDKLKRYEAIPPYEEALIIFKRVTSMRALFSLPSVLLLPTNTLNRDTIDVGHEYCMCNQCSKVKEKMERCTGCRVWYCDKECQLQHWATHKPLCNVCLHCDAVLTKLRHCSRCLKAKYCGAECSRAHWSEHKKNCVARSSK
jgi:hypothetical protein